MSHYVYLPIIPEKGARKTEMSEDNQPEVGVFFVIGDELFIESTPLSSAESYGDDSLIHPGDHASFWKQVIKVKESLSGTSYDYFPRGRVLFNVKEAQYWVYVDRCTHTDPVMIGEIVCEFGLPEEKTEVRLDSYYRCHACNPRYVPDSIGLDGADESV